MTFEEAAGLAIGVAAAALGLFRELRIAPLAQLYAYKKSDSLAPDAGAQSRALSGAEYILISGGSTATGTRAIQLARL